MITRAYKYRFYPTPEQAILFSKTFGCVRYVYNWALDLKTKTYAGTKKSLSFVSLCAHLTKLKKDPAIDWLKEPSSVTLQQSLRHLDTAFQNFFKKTTKYPSFKKRNDRQSATFTRSAFTWRNRRKPSRLH